MLACSFCTAGAILYTSTHSFTSRELSFTTPQHLILTVAQRSTFSATRKPIDFPHQRALNSTNRQMSDGDLSIFTLESEAKEERILDLLSRIQQRSTPRILPPSQPSANDDKNKQQPSCCPCFPVKSIFSNRKVTR